MMPIDPCMEGEDIIDESNNFCIACGVEFYRDDIMDYGDQDQGDLEGYCAHLTGATHRENTDAYRDFILAVEELQKVKELSKKWSEECEDDAEKKQRQNLIFRGHEYEQGISDFRERKKWRNGIEAIESYMYYLQSTARRVLYTQEMSMEDDNELDELSTQYQKTGDIEPQKREKKLRSKEEKNHSRDRKRLKKKAG